MRGLAVLAVVVFHGVGMLGHHWLPVRVVIGVGHCGWLGVEIFFALSGFLITGILLRSKTQPFGSYVGQFYLRRALRIFPLYFGVLVLLNVVPMLVAALRQPPYERFVHDQWWFWIYGQNAVRNYFGVEKPTLEFGWFELTHFWTLAVEEHFYLVWPFIVYAVSERRLLAIALGWFAVSTAERLIADPHASGIAAAIWSTPRWAGGLAIGSCGAVLLRWWQGDERWLPLTRRVAVACWGAVVVVAIAQRGLNPMLRLSLGLAAPLASAGTTALLLTIGLDPAGREARLLANRTLVWFGTYSYGIYVYHGLWGPWTRSHFPTLFGSYTLNAVVHLVRFFVVPIAVAVVSYQLYERPFLRLKSRRPKHA